MVTGAGGSIGSELCRQLARSHPARLVLLGHGENSIFDVQCQLREAFPYLDMTAVIADVRDRGRLLHSLPNAQARGRLPRRRAQARTAHGRQPG